MYTATESAATLCLHGVFINLAVLFHAEWGIRPGRIAPLIVAGPAGVPLGVRLLAVAGSGTLQTTVVTLAAAGALVYPWGAGFGRMRHESLAMIPVGLLSGVMGGATTMGGPPVVLFLAGQRVGVDRFRATLAFYFLLLNGMVLPAYVSSGLMTGRCGCAPPFSLPERCSAPWSASGSPAGSGPSRSAGRP